MVLKKCQNPYKSRDFDTHLNSFISMETEGILTFLNENAIIPSISRDFAVPF